jgi:hypothetical protein
VFYGAPLGLNKTYGDIELDSQRFSSSDGMDTRFDGHLFPVMESDTESTPDYSNAALLHWQNIFGTLIMGIGDGNNVSLIKEASATDPTPTAITYSPGALVSCLGSIIIGGATSALRLVVGRVGTTTQIISDTSATVDGTMNSGLNSLWAVQQTTLTDFPILFYAGTAIKTLLITDSISTAPTTVRSNIPAGGFGLGLLARGGGPLRWYICVPTQSKATGAHDGDSRFKVIHMNQEGGDLQDMQPGDFLGLGPIRTAAIYRDGIVATDTKRIVWNNDATKQDLGIFRDRELQADFDYRVANLRVNGPELRAWVYLVPKPGTLGITETDTWEEAFDPRTNSWHVVTTVANNVASSAQIIAPNGLPISLATGYGHAAFNDGWYRQPIETYGTNPFFSMQARTQNFADATSFKGPKLVFPGLQGWPSVISRIIPFGNRFQGGAGSSIKYTIGGVFKEFNYSGYADDYRDHGDLPDNSSPFYRAQLQIDYTRGSTTDVAGNAVPVAIEGYTFVGPEPRPPRFIEQG